MSACSVEGCNKAVRARGWCPTHYRRWSVHGDVNVCTTNRHLPVEERFWMKVRKGPGCWEWAGSISPDGYGMFMTGSKGKFWPAHRYAYTDAHGEIPEGMLLDHRCHNRGCVNPGHLRIVTRKQNSEHRLGARVDSTTGVLGVYKKKGKYVVKVGHNGKKHYGGLYADLAEADMAARALRNKLYTHNDHDKP